MAVVAWKEGVLVSPHLEQGVLIVTDQASHAVFDLNLAMLCPLIEEGVHSEDEMALKLHPAIPAATTYETLARLRERGWLAEERQAPPWTVRVHPLPSVPAEWRGQLEETLREAGWSVEPEGELELVLCLDLLHPDLADYARQRRGLWLPIKPVGNDPSWGPLLGQPEQPCYFCLRQRLDLNRPAVRVLEARGQAWSRQPGRGAVAMVWQETALQLSEAAPDRLRIHRLRPNEEESHPVLRLPDCPECGQTPIPICPADLELEPAPKPRPDADRGQRLAELFEELERHNSPVTGVIFLNPLIESQGVDFPIYQGVITSPLRHVNAGVLSGCVAGCVGKSFSAAHARATAICEAIERYSGNYRPYDPVRKTTMADLGELAVDPRVIQQFSERQYRDRETLNQHVDPFNLVPVEFDPHRECYWSPVWSLTQERWKFLPTAFAYYHNYHLDDPWAKESVPADSNGCAGGASLPECLMHGLFELIERDAIALWWYNRILRPRLDLDDFGPEVQEMRLRFQRKGRTVWALDITNDVGVPVVAAVAVPTGSQGPIFFGFGCHPEVSRALSGALSEVAQVTAYFLGEMNPFKKYDALAAPIQEWMQGHDLETDPYFRGNDRLLKRADFPVWEGQGDFRAEVDALRLRLEAMGLEVLALDQSRPEFPIRVAKVFVPGLRHFWGRYAPGRLYTAPVELGWLEKPLAESELNPTPFFI